MLDKVTYLENELQSMKDQLRLKTDEVGKEVLLKHSMHDDLAKARTMVRYQLLHDLYAVRFRILIEGMSFFQNFQIFFSTCWFLI